MEEVGGARRHSDGALLRISPDLWGPAKIEKYYCHNSPGWTKSDFGFYIFTRYDNSGTKYVFPGIRLNNQPVSGRFNREPEHDKAGFESYVRSVIEHSAEQKKLAEQDLDILLHDLRQLSATIISNAEMAKLALHRTQKEEAKQRIESVIAAQHMLKVRTDLLDLSGNPNASRPVKQIPIFKKLDKVLRCFGSFAEGRGVHISLKGECFRRIRGPDVFEIVPYIIVDNAIKYSPSPGELDVSIWNLPDRTQVTFRSTGPVIEGDEREKIFARGYRSRGAIKTGLQGSGIGLFLAKSLVQEFGGTLGIDVASARYAINGGTYTDVCFEVSLPSFD